MKYKVTLYWTKEYLMEASDKETRLDSLVEKNILVNDYVSLRDGELSWSIQPLTTLA
jgi:hypothetical protein